MALSTPFDLAEQSRRWSYRLFGPTKEPLKHEFFLWISLILLTISTLQGVYRTSMFGSESGDLYFLSIASLWLSRHLLLKWLIIKDSSTTSSPSLLGLVTHWLSTFTFAGQYCDRPDMAAVNKQLGLQATASSQDDYMMRTQIYPSWIYTVQYVKLRLWYPLTDFIETVFPRRPKRDRESTSTNIVGEAEQSTRRDRRDSSSSSWWSIFHPLTWIKMIATHGPSLQFCVYFAVPFYYILKFLFEPFYYGGGATDDDHMYDDGDGTERHEYFQIYEAPSWKRMALYFSFVSVTASLVMFGRVLLPIPSWVAGHNVLPSVRAQARGSATAHSGKSKKYQRSTDTSTDTLWAEQYSSIINENRFRLFCKVAMLRILDALVVCAVLPRTALSCRAMGHCSSRPRLWELSSIFFPSGLTGPRANTVAQHLFVGMAGSDRFVAVLTIISIFLVSLFVLLAQLSLLDKSHLAIMGYVAGEWIKVDDTSQVPKFGSSAPTHWDPRRRYKKGDLILHNAPGLGSSSNGPTIYKAASHSPEGPPFDLFLRATHDAFRNELGHPSTSSHVAKMSSLLLNWISILIALTLVYKVLDYPTDALLTTLAANLVACYGLVKIGRMNHSELIALREEIAPIIKYD